MTVESEAAAGLRFMGSTAAGLSLRAKLELLAAALILSAAVLVWALWPAKPVPEVVTAAPQVVQADHSVIAERAPDAHPPPARHMLPKGAVEERRTSVVVAPAPAASTVEVDLSLVRMPDNGRRVVASSPNGTVISALDIPIEAGLAPPPEKPWAAGLSYGMGRAVGVWVDRDVGRLRVGAAVERLADGRAEAQIRVGVRF